MGEHLIDGEFKSDKYDWCPAGFVPLKLTDPDARDVLKEYAKRRTIDAVFCKDLLEAIRIQEDKEKEASQGTCCGQGPYKD